VRRRPPQLAADRARLRGDAGLRACGVFFRARKPTCGHYAEQRLSVHPVVAFFDKDWNEKALDRAARTPDGKAPRSAPRPSTSRRRIQSRRGRMNEMCAKQVGETYAGGQLWRAAVQEMRLVLENRLGSRPRSSSRRDSQQRQSRRAVVLADRSPRHAGSLALPAPQASPPPVRRASA